MNANNENGNIRYITAADAKGLQSLVSKAVSSYGKARIAVQVAIIAVLIHAAKHNDYSQATALVQGLGKTKTARDVVLFFQDFGGFSTVTDATATEAPEGFNHWEGPDFIRERLDAAKATMFWLYKQPTGNVFRKYSLEEMARQFIQRHENAKKAAAKGKAELDDTLSDTTMQAVLNLVKFERIGAKDAKPNGKPKVNPEGKPERKAANA